MILRAKMKLFFYDEVGRPIWWHKVTVPANWDWPKILSAVIRRHPELQGYAGVVGENLGRVA